MKIALSLITHKKSKYGDMYFNRNISNLVSNSSFQIHVNKHDEDVSVRHITFTDIVKHYLVSTMYEIKFRQHLRGKYGIASFLFQYIRKIRDCFKLFFSAVRSPDVMNVELLRLRRFDNINSAHIQMFEWGLSTLANFHLVLEDDASISNPEDLIPLLSEISQDFEDSNRAFFINTSISNTFEAMGVAPNLEVETSMKSYFKPKEPFTNSASANLYNRKFIELLFADYNLYLQKARKLFIPIDQILNVILMQDHKFTRKIDAYHMQNPLFLQMSMDSNRDLS